MSRRSAEADPTTEARPPLAEPGRDRAASKRAAFGLYFALAFAALIALGLTLGLVAPDRDAEARFESFQPRPKLLDQPHFASGASAGSSQSK